VGKSFIASVATAVFTPPILDSLRSRARSASKPGKLIWGVGPVIVLPTATAPQLGQGKLSLGPGIVLLTTPGHWVIGALANSVWSIAGTGSRSPVNQFLCSTSPPTTEPRP